MFAWYVAVQPLTSKHISKSATLMGRTHISLKGHFDGKANLTASRSTAALREVIRSFLDQTPSVLSALRDAAARADVPSIRRAAHMIKGTSSILGARELSEQCAEIERVGQTGFIADAGSRVIAVEASYRTIEAALKAEIERLRP
jgi:histidine phosphotransfer protein HptB